MKGATLVLRLRVNNFERKKLLRVHRFLTVGAHIYCGSRNNTFRGRDGPEQALDHAHDQSLNVSSSK